MIKLAFDGIIGEAPNDAASVRAALRAGGPVTVNLNSPGGVATEGLAIFNLLTNHPARVDVIVDSLAASAASVIAMAGDSITMRAGSLLMIHDPSALAIGPASVMEKTAAVLNKMAGEFAKIYSQRSGLSEDRVRALMLDETWMTSSEAVDLHFATAASVEGASANAPAFDYRMFKHAPATLLALARPQSREDPMTTNPNPAPDATAEIVARAATAHLSALEASEIVAAAKGNLDTARDLIIAKIADRSGDDGRHNPANPAASGDPTLDNPATLHSAVRDVLIARMTGKPVAKGTPAEGLVGRSLLDLGAAVLQANGTKIKSWHRDRLAEQVFMSAGPHSTSDFPGLTLDAGNRVLLDAYAAAASPLKTVARRRSAQDFRNIAVLRLGEMPTLLEVDEGAEVHFGSRAESKEAFKLRTFARIFAITRQAIINDDLSAFADAARAWGIAAANVEADQLYALISGDGVVMEDGVALWNAAHANVSAAPTALDVDGLDEARKSLRNAKGLDGVTPLNLVPQFLLVGPSNETQGEKVLASLAAATVQDANPFTGRLTLLVEPRIADYSWFVFASPAQAEVLSFANLGDATGPELATKEGWSVLGQEFRCVDDFGAGATGTRGAFKNAGAAPA